jgi:hypothetical protein
MPEKLVPLILDGVPQSIAVAPDDFFRRPLFRKPDGEIVTYADAGYRLSDYHEDLTPYDGPKSKQMKAARERKATEDAKAEAPPAERPKAEAKKEA